ncbi:ABC transporter substrate-binding protein [Sporosarcina highlanderae]|uniref:ABC transporter substrate-binding protein n=1 Tax=Sporosarcina highlanderae TaxID=3035916 RepID=A0ABT8JTA2_9BACL|nr:ABC transporter substrate-binding protein [Sporosarcina highlanderae]MDN4608023.1 ABC transporter substrate-binding protein [Sporosarcina highlanderae]
MKIKSLLVMGILLAVLALTACTGKEATDKQPSPNKGNETQKPTGKSEENRVLTIAMGSDIVSFDIHNHNNTSTEAVHDNMFNYLFKRDDNNVIQPELVDTFEQLDELTVQMKLKPGVKFHNGDPLTSEDVKFTLERVATDDTLKEFPNYKQIKQVDIIDELTFKIVTHAPEPSLFHRLSRLGSGMLPKKYIEENGWDHFLANPVGTGPYKFKQWVRDDRIVMVPFEDYYEGKEDEWDEVVFRVIPENSTRVSELLTGGVDIAVNVPPSDWDRVDKNDGTSMKKETSNRTIMLILRSTEGYPTSDVRVRQAIDYAIDDGSLAEFALKGGGIPTTTRVGPGNFGHNPKLYNTYNYDLEKAKSLLAEAGYPDGFEMTLHSPRGRYLQDAEVTEMIAGMLTQAGIKVNIEFMEWSNFVEMRSAKKNKDAYLLGLGNSMFDGAYSVDWYRAARFEGETDYKNDEIEELLKASASNMNSAEREAQIQRIEEIAAEDVPHVQLYQETINTGVSDRIVFTPTQDEMIYVPKIKRK